MRKELQQPWVVEQDDVQLFTDELLQICERVAPEPINILEFGAGGSTLYYPKLLTEKGIKYKWLAVEHEVGWGREVMKYTDHDTTVEIREIPKSYWHRTTIGKDLTCIHAYTQCPQMLKIEPQSFDLIYVDGRFRRRCLESASILIKPDGLVILDNAERKWYHETLRRLFDGQFVKMHWWKGKVKAR